MEIIIGEHVKDNTFAHKRIQIPDSEIEHILDVIEFKIKTKDTASELQKAYQNGYRDGKSDYERHVKVALRRFKDEIDK